MAIQVQAHELRRGDVLVDGISPVLITTTADVGLINDIAFVQITARPLDIDLDNDTFEFLEEHHASRLIADEKWAG